MIYSIEKTKSALLVIDVQNEYANESRPLFVQDFHETTSKINQLIRECRKEKLPIIVVKHVHDKLGRDVGRMGDFSPDEVFTEGSEYTNLSNELDVAADDIQITKSRYSCFINTNLEGYLKTLDIDTLIITGFMTGYCCVTTARHAHDLDYKVIYVNDANSGPAFGDLGFGDVSTDEIKRVTATLLAGGVAEVILTDEVISRLQ